MSSFDGEQEDVFYETYENVRGSVDSVSSGGSFISEQELASVEFGQEFWGKELVSVGERRARFLRGMGLDESQSSRVACTQYLETANNRSPEKTGIDRMTESSAIGVDSSPSQDCEDLKSLVCSIRDLDSGKKFIVQDSGQDGLFNTLREVGSDRLITLQEFEALLGLSNSVQQVMQAGVTPGEELCEGQNMPKKKCRRWWRNITPKKKGICICNNDVNVKDSKIPRSMRIRVQKNCKRYLELSALYTGQEIQAHKGSIRVMRFNPSGWYLASGGDDCVVRIWQVGEVEASCECFSTDDTVKFIDKVKYKRFMLGCKGENPTAVIPKKVFKIRETALQEFQGHTSDILDLSWSRADCLLTSSKDKTVRMWQVNSSGCLKVFRHNDYVTCIQFNPVDDRYFISGSIDGKVRIWSISENRVVDWTDIRDIVTAICYRPDGKRFVVGSITGACRFYNYSDNIMQLDTEVFIQGRKKSTAKRITSLQFSLEDSERVMITSADSNIRIYDGVEVIHKFRGLCKTKKHLSASFSSDGRYVVSVGGDSHIYIWNTLGSPSPKEGKTMRSFEKFFSEGVSVAISWPGIDNIGASLNSSNLHPTPLGISDSSNRSKDSDCRFLGTLFCADSLSRASATWPEEKLLQSRRSPLQVDNPRYRYHQDRCRQDLTYLPALWKLVIVAASSDGTIRSFINYGLPARL